MTHDASADLVGEVREKGNLDRATIVHAALRLLDEVGIDGLSTRRLAAELGIKSASLYWHFKDQGELLLTLEPSLAAGMQSGLNYLEHYPYECTEQTLSRFLPNVVTYRALKQLGIERLDLANTLPSQVAVGLQRLYNRQNVDGGWGWWSGEESNPFVSGYAVFGLVQARQAGI